MRRGQALVEFALVVPIILFTFLGMAEVGFLFADQHGWQRGADVLADAAAIRVATEPGDSWRAGWQALADDERARAGCNPPDVSFPDGGQDPGQRVQVSWTCDYRPRITAGLWPGLRATIRSTAVIPPGP